MAAEPCRPVLPDHLIEDILERLPSKLVHRCRCLSRAWAAALSLDSFADRYLKLANRRSCPKILFLQDSAYHGPKMHMWSPEHPGGAPLMDIPRDLVRNSFSHNTIRLTGTASGIYYVCNPSTGRLAALPKGRSTGSPGHMELGRLSYVSLGLGYDSCTRKHKVVRIHYPSCNPGMDFPLSAGCEVYVVNSTGLWRPSERGVQEKPTGWVDSSQKSVFAHGYMYWLAHRQLRFLPSPEEMFIVSFSLSNEKFGTVAPPPVSTEKNLLVRHHLTELDGHLCLFCTHVYNKSPRRYHIWLLRGYETGTSDLHCQIDLARVSPEACKFIYNGHGIVPVATIDNGRRIIFIQPRDPPSHKSSFKLCVYDPVTRDIENLMDATSMLHCTRKAWTPLVAAANDIILTVSFVMRWLPTHALKTFMCVCRSWWTMIESNLCDVPQRTCIEFSNY
ncbi:hypothetical protein VPH35_055307 [Triticum aestivum]